MNEVITEMYPTQLMTHSNLQPNQLNMGQRETETNQLATVADITLLPRNPSYRVSHYFIIFVFSVNTKIQGCPQMLPLTIDIKSKLIKMRTLYCNIFSTHLDFLNLPFGFEPINYCQFSALFSNALETCQRCQEKNRC